MKLSKARVGIVFVLVILLLSILTILFWTTVRDTFIIPIYYFMWIGDLALKSVPQQAFLAVLILISFIIALNTLTGMRSKRYTRPIEDPSPQSDSRYLYWKKLCSNLYSSPFAQDSFAWEARKLILSIFAYQNRLETTEVEAQIKSGTLPVPDSIKKLIQQKNIQYVKPPPNRTENPIIRLRRWLFKIEVQQDPQIDSPIAEIVDFIEHLLEINHARK